MNEVKMEKVKLEDGTYEHVPFYTEKYLKDIERKFATALADVLNLYAEVSDSDIDNCWLADGGLSDFLQKQSEIYQHLFEATNIKRNN